MRLLSYGIDMTESYRRSADFVDKILKAGRSAGGISNQALSWGELSDGQITWLAYSRLLPGARR